MFAFFKRKRIQSEDARSSIPPSVAPLHSQSHSHVQRELVRVVLKDTLRQHGIPLSWLACEVFTISRSPGHDELHVQLRVMQWSEDLLHYAPALQQQLLLGLDRFDPSVDHSNYVISWRFAATCGFPLTAMPAPSFWAKSALPKESVEPVKSEEQRGKKQAPDLSKLEPSLFEDFAEPSNFAPTDISPLR
jgi:hypothetical protein